jgi:maltose alpha-D-glucosyltransferase / alpha-amylase
MTAVSFMQGVSIVNEGAGKPTLERLARHDWYKDAVIYQLHVKAFQDSDGSGMGDFRGILQRLDYIERLGANTIWLLPFYPSPLRDDGYDIADYRSINPAYGNMRDFRRLVQEAHRRGISVITELVINHTSDQHPWFQRARRARKGSAARNFYVWSDDDQSFNDTRIIFLDTETSNWTWDPVAGQFFWHRFYAHQPDLNFDNPRVLDEVIKVMCYWLDMGVDGLRLDAIPYLVEREGTNNENLPETHEVLKKIRRALDEKFPDRMLLAEANQWPEDTAPYFGDGDECHMAFHFPLMPRMYMALAQGDRHPVTDIMRQTPEIPENCQWAIFLRNHDELTLEMVTDRERDYLWETYAADRQARINLGIRRRLAPLMQNDRRKVELMNSLLLSMPGTPVIYYGDEIGMGDNIYVGDRDGVRTPMQWSADRNGGFSRANPQMLYLPPIMDPVYGFHTINVEAQEEDPSSLLNWMRRMIMVRRQHKVFGRGEFAMLFPRNRRILAYIRADEEETILCVANLSRSAQAVELDLSNYKGRIPIELISQAPFPPIGELPYLLTLSSFGTFWFLLATEGQAPSWHSPVPEPLPEFATIPLPSGRIGKLFDERPRKQIEQDLLPQYLPRQRWFGAKGREIRAAQLHGLSVLGEDTQALAIVETDGGDGELQRYLLPLSILWGEDQVVFGAPKLSYMLARVRRGPKLGALIDGAYDESLATELTLRMRDGAEIRADNGTLRFHGSERLSEIELPDQAVPLNVQQSNVSLAIGDKILLKIYRRLREGVQPEIEIARYLTERTDFQNAPLLLGSLEYEESAKDEPTVLASAFAFVANQGDAWSSFTHALEREIEQNLLSMRAGNQDSDDPNAPDNLLPYPLNLSEMIGARTGELHAALASDTDDPAFKREPVEKKDLAEWVSDTRKQLKAAFSGLEAARDRLRQGDADFIEAALARRDEVESYLASIEKSLEPAGARCRIHGDYHLGQVLVAENDIHIIDFEGEPMRPIDERRAKNSPLRDVAGMLRSFDYAVWSCTFQAASRVPDKAGEVPEMAAYWRDRLVKPFLDGYWKAAEATDALPDGEMRQRYLKLFLLQKVLYEINYELSSRPDWLGVPLRGLLDLLDGAAE